MVDEELCTTFVNVPPLNYDTVLIYDLLIAIDSFFHGSYLSMERTKQ